MVSWGKLRDSSDGSNSRGVDWEHVSRTAALLASIYRDHAFNGGVGETCPGAGDTRTTPSSRI